MLSAALYLSILWQKHAHTNDKICTDLRTLLFFYALFLLKSFILIQLGRVRFEYEKNTTKQKQNHLNQFADWLHVIQINWIDSQLKKSFLRKNFNWKSQFKWESMSKINQYESWKSTVCAYMFTRFASQRIFKSFQNDKQIVRWLNFYDTSTIQFSLNTITFTP